MALIQYPRKTTPAQQRRLVTIGCVVVAGGLALLFAGPQILPRLYQNPIAATIFAVVAVLVGLLMAAVGLSGLRLLAHWKVKEWDVQSRVADAQTGAPLQRGDLVALRLTLEARRAVQLHQATCRLLVGQKRTPAAQRTKRLYAQSSADPSINGRILEAGTTVTVRFDHRLPADLPVSSDVCSWTVTVLLKARGAPDFLQENKLSVHA